MKPAQEVLYLLCCTHAASNHDPKGVKLMPYFEITDGNGTTHTVDLLSEDPTDIKAEFKKFEAKKKAKKVYISTKEDKLASIKVYEPKSQEKND